LIKKHHIFRQELFTGIECISVLASTVCSLLINSQIINYKKGTPMGKAMTKSQIAAHLASKFELKKKDAVGILEEIAALAYREAKNSFTLPGIGKLVLVDRKARIGRNPATGAQINIPAKTVVKFRVAKAAKEAVLAQH
jgi:DNA-binding protein HU-beta